MRSAGGAAAIEAVTAADLMWRLKEMTAAATLACVWLLAVAAASPPGGAQTVKPPAAEPAAESDREREGLQGPVRRVRTEVSIVNSQAGRPVESPRFLISSSTFSATGRLIAAEFYPLPAPIIEDYAELVTLNERGDPQVREFYDADGALVRRERYAYEYDERGNWTTRAESIDIEENDRSTAELVRRAHRAISYYPQSAQLKPATAGGPKVAAKAAGLKPLVAAPTPTPTPSPQVTPSAVRAVDIPRPVYPPAAQSAGIAGSVLVAVVIDREGRVTKAEAVSGHVLLRESAVAAAKRARFEPSPAETTGQITYHFKIPEGGPRP